MKLCCVFNIPSLYRERIYLDIDAVYDCEWYFEREDNGINLFDVNKLKSVTTLEHRRLFSRFYMMKSLVGKVWKRYDFDAYLMIGAPMCVSIWVLCVLIRIFHPGKKIYFWTHGWYGKETMAEAVIKKSFLKLAYGLFVYGNYARKLLIRQGFREENLHVIHNSLNYDEQLALRNSLKPSDIYRKHFGNDYPVIIFIGRLTPVKKLDMLLESVSKLTAEWQCCNLVLVGDGAMRQSLENLAAELGIVNNVWFYGACYDEAENAELVYNADICVSPGNVGLTAIHSMMFGTPVITHNNFPYQMPEFESVECGRTGDFFEYGNIDSMSNTIKCWLEKYSGQREDIRKACFNEIDTRWNPQFQMRVFTEVLHN